MQKLFAFLYNSNKQSYFCKRDSGRHLFAPPDLLFTLADAAVPCRLAVTGSLVLWLLVSFSHW